ncbi:MAG: low-specificity L-threonine aldolase [Geminicoccaceae bacterium]|nr:low-specificity L-threonine aldolase [Geminicoccaceae bacterium]
MKTVDLRSDTVTRPTPGMRAAMAGAEVGDDVYGDDPTVAALYARATAMFGKEAALFFPSGTQSNLAAALAHCGRGDEYVTGDQYHLYCNEAGGAAVLGGISPCTIRTRSDGSVEADDVADAIKPDDPHCPVTRLLSLENTVSGRVVPLARLAAPANIARDAGLAVHLDGARLCNAAVALGVPPAELAAVADTVSVCLSKGLGTPAGTLLLGPEAVLARAYRARKILGGAMRQTGVLAAAGLYALEHHVARLADDHRRARTLAERLQGLMRLSVPLERVQTNMLFLRPEPDEVPALVAHLRAENILVSPGRWMRLVTHLDVDDEDVERVGDAITAFYARNH